MEEVSLILDSMEKSCKVEDLDLVKQNNFRKIKTPP